MNSGKMRKTAFLLSAVIGCGATCLTGCSRQQNEDKGTSVYSPTIPESRVDPETPGETLTCKIGETVEYQDKVSFTVDKVIEIDEISNNFRSLIVEMTIANHSDKAIDCQSMTHFSVEVDGKEDIAVLQDPSATVASRRYYTAVQSDLQSFNQAIEPGETVSGYISLGAPTTWESLKVMYFPYQYYNTDKIEFEITEDALTHFNSKDLN